MSRLLILSVLVLTALAGCPFNDPTQNQTAVDPQITISSTSGEAPLRVVVSASASTSSRGEIVRYAWNFADLATADQVTAEYTFTLPGRYPITLTVVDSAGQQASTRVYVRISGGDVTAVITANTLSGTAPLTVQFDGSDSTAIDDTILDYYWDFGDNQQSRLTAPLHTFANEGTFTVQLRAVSAGGVEGYAEATVTVGPPDANACLQFNGTQYAILPVSTDEAVSAFSFETWCKPDSTGGTVVNFGVPNVSIRLAPDNGITVITGSESHSIAAPILAGQWQHLALTYSSDTGINVYLDGASLGSLALSGEYAIPLLSLGAGFNGKLARVRLWSIARTESEIAAGVNGNLSGFEDGLLGEWPLNEGSGQILNNNADAGESGVLGAGDSDEPADPAWSNDSP